MESDRYEYLLAQSAEIDINDIFEYIAEVLSNPDAAGALADALEEKFEEICTVPKLGRIIDNEFAMRDDVRIVHVKNYLVYYFIDDVEKKIIVIRVIYNRRNQEEALSNTDYI